MIFFQSVTQAYSEKEKKKQKQKKNQRPSDYQFGRSTTEQQETPVAQW